MKVKDAIKQLARDYGMDDDLVILWCDKDQYNHDGRLTDTAWLTAIDAFDNNDYVSEVIDGVLAEAVADAAFDEQDALDAQVGR